MSEKRIEFRNSYPQKDIKAKLIFEVYTFNGNDEIEVEFGCGEDIESMMKAFFNRKWDEMFDEKQIDVREICDVGLIGFRVFGKTDKGSFGYRMDNTQSASIYLNLEEIADENANKIQEIRKIIGNA
jgi:hypothetical protein